MAIKNLLQMFFKMNIKTNLLEDFVIFLDATEKQNKNYKTFSVLFVVVIPLFSFYLSYKYLNE